jgi:hypothetical protein
MMPNKNPMQRTLRLRLDSTSGIIGAGPLIWNVRRHYAYWLLLKHYEHTAKMVRSK